MEMMDKRVGVFMQLYRNEPSMHKAIQSVLNQTYTNIKFYILVSDKTKSAVMEYALKDSRIEVLDGKPGESSYNYDKYIAGDGNSFFSIIDADDWYEKEYLEEMVSFAEEYHTDITACGNYFVDEQGSKIGDRKQPDMHWKVEDTAEVLPYMYGFFRTMWGKLITSEVILNYNQGGLPASNQYGGYGGDTIFMFNLFQKNQRIGICSKVLYNYRISSTGGSYVLREGRLESDALLFAYVKNVLCDFGGYGELQERFLYQVYGEAIKDTVRLILNQKLPEEDKTRMLLYIFHNSLTNNLLERDRKECLSVPAAHVNQSYREELNSLIFKDLAKCSSTPKTVSAYLELFEIIYGKWKGILSAEEFAIILKKKELFDALKKGEFSILFAELLEILHEVKLNEAKCCLQLLRRVTANPLLKPLLQEKKVALTYSVLLKKVNQGENEAAFSILRGYFSDENMPNQAEQLVDFWINFAASLEDANEFVLAKEVKVEELIKNSKIQEAKLEYKDLETLGVNDAGMLMLKELLYG